jgi:hypothetical protein
MNPMMTEDNDMQAAGAPRLSRQRKQNPEAGSKQGDHAVIFQRQ